MQTYLCLREYNFQKYDEVADLGSLWHERLFLGKVEDVVLDVTNKKISGLALTSVNQNVLDIKNYQGVVIPYRIVKEVGDIILVRHIPGAFKVSEPLFGE